MRFSLENNQMCTSSALKGVSTGHPVTRQKVLTEKRVWVSLQYRELALHLSGTIISFSKRLRTVTFEKIHTLVH